MVHCGDCGATVPADANSHQNGAPRHQVFEQASSDLRVLRRPAAKPQHVLATIRIHPHRRQHVVVPEHDPVEVDHQHVQLAQVPFGQLLQNPRPRLDGLPRDLRLAHPNLVGHRRQHRLVLARRHALQHHLQHPVRQPLVRLQRRIRRNLNLARLLGPRPLLAQPWLVNLRLPLLQRHTPRLHAVPVQLPVGVAAPLLLRPRHLLGAHPQDGLDGRPAHHVDHLVDGPLALLQQLYQRNQQLSVLRQPVRQLPVARRGRARHDLVRFLHRWRLLLVEHTPD